MFAELDSRLGQFEGVTREVNKRNVVYRKGKRYFIELSTDDTALHVWAVLGAAPGNIHPAWIQGKNERWWKLNLTNLADLDGVWPDLLAAWGRLPDLTVGGKPLSSLQGAIAALEGDAKAAFETFEAELLNMSSTLERNVTQFYIGYGLPVEVTGLMRDGYMQVEVRPPDPDRIPPELYREWEDRSKERRALNLHAPADALRAMPLLRAVHQQFVEEIPYRRPNVRHFMRELRDMFADLEGVTVQSSKSTVRFVVNGVDIARVYINLEDVFLMLRHQFATLHNPDGIGQVKEDGPIANWPDAHFGAYFSDPAEVERLKPLIQQTYEAHRAPVQ